MTYDEFVRLGKEAGFTGEDGEEVAVKIGRLVKLVEQATLERAAKIVESQSGVDDSRWLLDACAAAIRSIKDAHE